MDPRRSGVPLESALGVLARRFADGADEFAACPLYRQLCLTVAADDRLLAIAAEGRPGQQPPYLLFAAVQYLVLEDTTDELARWYVSVDGSNARPPETAGPAFTAFCLRHRGGLVDLVRERLVQTNVVKRAAALRLGLAHVARRTREPVILIEIGASAGVLLAFDRYRYLLAGRAWGQPASQVEITTDWRGSADSLPDLDRLPTIAHRFGIDLSPIDPGDPLGRRWLRALVWPGNEAQWALLERALDLVADNRPRILAGDAIEILGRPRSLDLRPNRPVVVFHSAVRAHLPTSREDAFERAIRNLGRDRPVFWLSLEGLREPEREVPDGRGQLLQLVALHGDREEVERLAVFDAHAEWAVPLAEQDR